MSDTSPASSDGLGRKTLHSLGWTTVDRWGNRLFSLITFTLLGRLLAPEEFGLVALGTIFIAIANLLTDSGFSKALVQRRDLTREHIDTAFWASLAISLVVLAILGASATGLESVLAAPGLAAVIVAMGISTVLTALSATPAALLERDFQFKRLALRRMLGTFAGGLAAIGLALAGAGVWSLVAQTVVASLVGVVVLWTSTSWRPSRSISLPALRDLWRMGSNVLGIGLVGLVSSQGDRFIIGLVAGPEALGYYYLAIRLITILSEMLSTVFSSVSLTAFSRLQDDGPRLLSWLYRFISGSSILAIPLFMVMAATAPVLVPFVFGDQWRPAVPAVQILTFLGAINSIAYFDRNVLLATGHARSAFWMTLGQTVLGLAFVGVATPFGITWVAVAIVARQYLYWPVRLVVLRRSVGIDRREYVRRLALPFAAALLAVVPVVLVDRFLPGLTTPALLYLVVAPAVSLLLYAGLLWLIARSLVRDILDAIDRIPRLSALSRRLPRLRQALG